MVGVLNVNCCCELSRDGELFIHADHHDDLFLDAQLIGIHLIPGNQRSITPACIPEEPDEPGGIVSQSATCYEYVHTLLHRKHRLWQARRTMRKAVLGWSMFLQPDFLLLNGPQSVLLFPCSYSSCSLVWGPYYLPFSLLPLYHNDSMAHL